MQQKLVKMVMKTVSQECWSRYMVKRVTYLFLLCVHLVLQNLDHLWPRAVRVYLWPRSYQMGQMDLHVTQDRVRPVVYAHCTTRVHQTGGFILSTSFALNLPVTLPLLSTNFITLPSNDNCPIKFDVRSSTRKDKLIAK